LNDSSFEVGVEAVDLDLARDACNDSDACDGLHVTISE
jgi:hypothetical protein